MRRGRFCPKCGKSTEELQSGLCGSCFLEKMELSDEVPDKIVLGTCKMCGRVFMGEKRFPDAESATEGFLARLLKQREIKTATYRIEGASLRLTIELEAGDLDKTIERALPIVNKAITCRFCALQKASYFNVTIQVRAPKEMEEKIVREIEGEISRLNMHDNYSFVSGIQKLKEGTDLFVGSKGAAEHVASMMKKRYKATIKISRKLYGLIEGKKSYRDTVLVSVR